MCQHGLEVALPFAADTELSILAIWALLSILSCTRVLSARGMASNGMCTGANDVGHFCSPVFGLTFSELLRAVVCTCAEDVGSESNIY